MLPRHDPNLLLDYLEGDLSEAQRAQFEAELAKDDDLAALVRELQADREALRGAPMQEPPAGLCEDAIERLERGALLDEPVVTASSSSPVSRFRLAPFLTYTGIAAALALAVTVVYQSLNQGGGQYAADEKYNVAQAPIDARHGMERSPSAVKAEAEPAADALADATPPPVLSPSPSVEPDAVGGRSPLELAEAGPGVGDAAVGEGMAADTLSPSLAEADQPTAARARLSMHEPIADEEVLGTFGMSDDADVADDPSGAVASTSLEARLGRAMSAGVTAPVSVNVVTDSAMKTRAQLDAWAVSNRLQVAELPPPPVVRKQAGRFSKAVSKDEVARSEGEAVDSDANYEAQSTQQQLVVFVDHDRVDELVQVLSHGRLNQQARVVEPIDAYKNVPSTYASGNKEKRGKSTYNSASATNRDGYKQSLYRSDRSFADDSAEAPGRQVEMKRDVGDLSKTTTTKAAEPEPPAPAAESVVRNELREEAENRDAGTATDQPADQGDPPQPIALAELLGGFWHWEPARTIAVQVNIDQLPEAAMPQPATAPEAEESE